MTTVEAPVSHLREDPFELAQEQLRKVAEIFNIDQNLIEVLQQCKKAVVVSVPITMDSGHGCSAPRPISARRSAARMTTRFR